MVPYTGHDLQLMVSMSLMVLGVVSILAGLLLLVGQATGKDVNTIANQAARLAQKGLAEEVAGLVGNARALVEALNQLARTKAGIGIFLFLFGFGMMLVAFFMARPF
jgi:hypothetical protein